MAQAAMDWQNPQMVVQVVQGLQAEVVNLRAEINLLKGGGGASHEKDKKSLKELKSFSDVPKWDGSDKSFGDFEFKLHQFLAPFERFEAFMNWVKELDEPPTEQLIDDAHTSEQGKNDKIDVKWMNRELYSILSLKTEADPLQISKGEKENYAFRGAAAWHRITREVAGKTGTRLERLADKVHHPKKVESYADALAAVNKWKLNCAELAKIEGQQISDITKRTTLKGMIPTDLAHDLEKDKSLKDWTKAWNFVIEQIPLRKEWRPLKKKDKDDMDLSMAEEGASGDQDDEGPRCGECNPTDDSLKARARAPCSLSISTVSVTTAAVRAVGTIGILGT